MDEEERRRRAVEAGKEMLERFKAERLARTSQASDDDSLRNGLSRQYLGPEGPSANESVFSRDVTFSSVSMSEGEAEGELEVMAGRVAELEELVHGKEAVVEALTAEFEHLRGENSSPNSSHNSSHTSSIQNHSNIIAIYHSKLQEFELAVQQRDKLIEDLTSSLVQALGARDNLVEQLNVLNAKLEDRNVEKLTQEKISALESNVGEQKNVINDLKERIRESYDRIQKLEMEKELQNSEIGDYKMQINNLNKEIRAGVETIEQQKLAEARVDKVKKEMQVLMEKFTAEINANALEHQKELADLEKKYDHELESIKKTYERNMQTIRDEKNQQENVHSKELAVFQAQVVNYKKTVEALRHELMNRSEMQSSRTNSSLQRSKSDDLGDDLLNEQIRLHKIQLDDMTAKYMAAASVLESKESIERSLEQALSDVAALKQENEILKFKMDDLSARYAAAQSLIENTQLHERSLNTKIYDLEKTLSRISGISSTSSPFDATVYQNLDDFATQYQHHLLELEEKAHLEKKLQSRIEDLEASIRAANEELEQANNTRRTYEKQLKEMKNTCDKLMQDAAKMRDSRNENEEIENLKKLLREKEAENHEYKSKLHEINERAKKVEVEREKLKSGLAAAWAECAEYKRLNQTLMGDSKIDDSIMSEKSHIIEESNNNLDLNLSNFSLEQSTKSTTNDSTKTIANSSNNSELAKLQSEIEILTRDNERLVNELKDATVKLTNYQEMEKKIDKYHEQFDKLKTENEKLLKQIADLKDEAESIDSLKQCVDRLNKENEKFVQRIDEMCAKHTAEINEAEKRHQEETEELRTYFEQKCLQMEKQYSEEIFSQQSKKMSDDSEIEELTEDLYFGGGGDCANVTNFDNRSKVETPLTNGDQSAIIAEYKAKIESLQEALRNIKENGSRTSLLKAVNQCCQTDFDETALENSELTKLRAAYNHQLEEQVALARLDIVNALQDQIQTLLTIDADVEENWPLELLELRNKFTSNAKREIQELKDKHDLELRRLKEEHNSNLNIANRTIKRYEEEIKKIKEEYNQAIQSSHSEGEKFSLKNDLLKERDNLNKTCRTLRNVIGDLINYFAICEDEVNNSFISEVQKRRTPKRLNSSNSQIGENAISPSSNDDRTPKENMPQIKRVHFAPNTGEIASIVNSDNESISEIIEKDIDIVKNFRRELNDCLTRLKTESAQILGISFNSDELKADQLSTKLLWMTKDNDELNAKLADAENLIVDYQEEVEQLKMKIHNMQKSLIENKQEIISEGYGEQDQTCEDELQDISQVQDRARSVIMNGSADSSYLLKLVEELCRHNDKIADDGKKDKDDLLNQIIAADKQLKAMKKFLDEQTSEREIERDEAAKKIQHLETQKRDLERTIERDQRMTSESSLSPVPSTESLVLRTTDTRTDVEALETQLREMSSMMSDMEAKKSEAESELKAAVDKIWVLRDIIADLEQQVQSKVDREDALLNQMDQLEKLISAQNRNQQELALELESIKSGSENLQLNEHISHLQEELRKHKVSSEHFNSNSSTLKQIRMELREMHSHVDKRIKELEALHVCGSSLSISQPSEDVSIRDQIEASRCPTPDDPNAPPTLPLDQVLKLKDKLMKHARAEEVALKRIKDLNIQLTSLKNQNEELIAEQEILQQTASEQLFQMEAMRGRLEQHKQDAPFAQRQATSRLELQLHEANTNLHSLERKLADKDLELKELRDHLERANHLLMDKEAEITNIVQSESNVIQKLKDRLEIVEEEKKLFESKLGKQERVQMELPQLLDSMLADKNEEIDHLKEQLQKKEKQLEFYLALDLDENQLKEKQQEPKNSARTLSDILSINSECEELQNSGFQYQETDGIREIQHSTRNAHNVSSFRVPGPGISKNTLEFTPISIDANKSIFVPELNLGSESPNFSNPRDLINTQVERSEVDFASPDKNYVEEKLQKKCQSKTSPKRSKSSSSTSDELLRQQIQVLDTQLNAIKDELSLKSSTLRQREAELLTLQTNLEKLRFELKETIESLTRDKLLFKTQFELSQVAESKLKKDLEQVENAMKLKTDELDDYKSKIQVNEKILMELKNENSKLKKNLEIVEKQTVNDVKERESLEEKCQEVKYLSELVFQKDVTIETLETRNLEIENENKQLYEYRTKYELCKEEIVGCQIEIQRLTQGLNNRDDIIRRLEEMARRNSFSGASSPSDSNKNQEYNNKTQEIHHLQEYLKEKDKVIRQMNDDSKSLHRALETIQNKMKESGNVVELRRKLKDEKKMNAQLKESLDKALNELDRLKEEGIQLEDEGIEDMVHRELNLSAQLDQQIMDAIESEPEEGAIRRMEKHSCNSLNIKPAGYRQQDKLMEKLSEMKSKLSQTNKEKEEISQLKDDLEIEREMLRSQVNEYENRILQIKCELSEERQRVTSLDKEILRQRDVIKALNARIEKERKNIDILQEQDAELLSALRKKLTASVKNESKLREELSQARQETKNLEIQLNSVDRREKVQSENLTVPSELLKQEQQKYLELSEKYENLKTYSEEVKDNLKLMEVEKKRCEEQLEIAIEKQENLTSKLDLVECERDNLNADLKRMKSELKTKEEEYEFLRKKLKTMTDAEAKRQQHKANEHGELKRLRRDLESSKSVLKDLEADLEHSKTELRFARDEESRLKEVISELQSEIQINLRREVELSESLKRERNSSEKNVPSKFVEMIKELNDNLERVSREKNVLLEKLNRVREERETFAARARNLETQLTQKKLSLLPGTLNPVTEEKLQHFYGQFLRTDSRRKALIYQKRYLLGVLTCYQRSEENTLAFLAQLTQTERTCVRKGPNRKNFKSYFRSVVLVVITIHRIKWLITRWRSGKRIGAKAILSNADQSFVPLRTSASSHSPPVRDFQNTNGDQNSNFDEYLQRFLKTYNMNLKKDIDADHSD